MFTLLAIGAAAVYRIADYAGGRATRSAPAAAITFIGQLTALIRLLIIVPFTGAPLTSLHDWIWIGFGGFGGLS